MLSKSHRLPFLGTILIVVIICSLLSQGAVDGHNFKEVTQNHTISATFDPKPGPEISLNGVLNVIPATATLTPTNIPESAVIPLSLITITPTPAAPTPEPEYLTIDFSGNTTIGLLDNNGALISNLVASNGDGSNSIEIPSGTIVTDLEGKIVKSIQVTETQIPLLPDNKVALSKAYDFRPSPAGFSNPIIISLGYDTANMPQKLQSICLAFYTPQSGWQDLAKAGDMVAEARECCGEVNHFTVFAVVANRSPANFSLTQVQINRSLEKFTDIVTFFLTTGRNAVVTGLVTNEGGCQGIYDGTLLLDEEPVETQNIDLPAGENRTLTFMIRNLSPGMHTVQIGSFKYNVPGAESWINWWLISGMLIAIALFVWLINRRFRGSRKIDRGTTKVKL